LVIKTLDSYWIRIRIRIWSGSLFSQKCRVRIRIKWTSETRPGVH